VVARREVRNVVTRSWVANEYLPIHGLYFTVAQLLKAELPS
jgi:hypothetical protein